MGILNELDVFVFLYISDMNNLKKVKMIVLDFSLLEWKKVWRFKEVGYYFRVEYIKCKV